LHEGSFVQIWSLHETAPQARAGISSIRRRPDRRALPNRMNLISIFKFSLCMLRECRKCFKQHRLKLLITNFSWRYVEADGGGDYFVRARCNLMHHLTAYISSHSSLTVIPYSARSRSPGSSQSKTTPRHGSLKSSGQGADGDLPQLR